MKDRADLISWLLCTLAPPAVAAAVAVAVGFLFKVALSLPSQLLMEMDFLVSGAGVAVRTGTSFDIVFESKGATPLGGLTAGRILVGLCVSSPRRVGLLLAESVRGLWFFCSGTCLCSSVCSPSPLEQCRCLSVL